MNHRAVAQGIVISAIAYTASIGLLRVHDYIGNFLYELSAYSGFFWGPLEKIINNLYWFAPAFIIGFKTDHSPVKSAAIIGLWIGFFLSIYGMSKSNLETHDPMMVAAYIYRTICVMAEISFLFTLASAAGHILSNKRKLLTKGIWTLPTSSEQSFSFAPVVSAVAFVYPACCGLFRPGHSVVRAAGAKRSIDHADHHCYRPCSAAGLACSDSAAAHHNHKKTITPS